MNRVERHRRGLEMRERLEQLAARAREERDEADHEHDRNQIPRARVEPTQAEEVDFASGAQENGPACGRVQPMRGTQTRSALCVSLAPFCRRVERMVVGTSRRASRSLD